MNLQSHVRRIAHRHLIAHRNIAFQLQSRCFSIPPTPSEEPKGPTEPYHYEKPEVQPAWLSKKILENPTSRGLFLKLMTLFGYGSKKQIAGRRAMYLYESLCADKAEEDRDFWQNECDLPPTFQSWFTITNLHVWLLTVRLRALPPPYGTFFIQALIDRFFFDIEDRIRIVLQPYQDPAPSSNDTASGPTGPSSPRKRGRASDKLVSQQMRDYKDQWTGQGLAFDFGMVKGDTELAGAVWRNLLGARGARGVPLTDSEVKFRRSINLVGSTVSKENLKKLETDLESEEAKDDGSGVHDYPAGKTDKYVVYPELMVEIIGYLRRELKRLESISDERIMGSMKIGEEIVGIEPLKFGRVRP